MYKNVVICLCVGQAYSDKYVYNLRNMVARHLTTNHDFICYSDRLIPNISTIKISDPNRFEPVWNKIQLLNLPELTEYTHKAYFDLDVVIHSNIDWVFKLSNSELHVIESKWKTHRETIGPKNTGCNSSVMLWQNAESIQQHFAKSPDTHMMRYIGIDRFLWNEKVNFNLIPNDEIYSFREGSSLRDRLPYTMRSNKSICIYNGKPKPDQCIDCEPAKTHWY